MTTLRQAAEQALEALEESLGYVQEEAENAQRLYGQYPTRQARIQGLKDDARKHMDAITAIREALAEHPAQHRDTCIHCGDKLMSDFTDTCYACGQEKQPASKPWVGLTDEEIDELYGSPMELEHSGALKWVRVIEAKLKEKNT